MPTTEAVLATLALSEARAIVVYSDTPYPESQLKIVKFYGISRDSIPPFRTDLQEPWYPDDEWVR